MSAVAGLQGFSCQGVFVVNRAVCTDLFTATFYGFFLCVPKFKMSVFCLPQTENEDMLEITSPAPRV